MNRVEKKKDHGKQCDTYIPMHVPADQYIHEIFNPSVK